MSAKRRNRKNQSKRSTNHVDPYTERYRKASDGAKAARAAARSRGIGEAHFDEVHIGVDISQARIVSASLVPEGQGTGRIFDSAVTSKGQGRGYVIEVGEDRPLFGDDDLLDEAVDAAEERGRRFRARQEALRAEAASDAATLGQRGAQGVAGVLPEAPASEPLGEHKAFFEAEVNLVPTHIDTQPCTCDIRKDHWVEVGEI